MIGNNFEVKLGPSFISFVFSNQGTLCIYWSLWLSAWFIVNSQSVLELALVTSLESVKIAADMEASSVIGDLKIKVMSSGGEQV